MRQPASERERERALLGTMSITGWSRARPGDRRCLALCRLDSLTSFASGVADFHCQQSEQENPRFDAGAAEANQSVIIMAHRTPGGVHLMNLQMNQERQISQVGAHA